MCVFDKCEQSSIRQEFDLCLCSETHSLFILSFEDYVEILRKLNLNVEDFIEFVDIGKYHLKTLKSLVCLESNEGERYCPIFVLRNFKGTIKVFYDFEWENNDGKIIGIPNEYVVDESLYAFRLADVDGIDKVTGKEIHYILV